MRFPSISLLLFGAISLGLAASAAAMERGALPGYGDIRFGMPESELRTKVAIVVSHDNETDEGGVWLKGEKPIELTGPRFALLILVDEGVVKRVSLLRIARMGKVNCKASFDAMVNAVAAQHGSPDVRESPGISGGEDSYRAFFRFADGAFIEVNSDRSAEGDACFDSIVHFAPTPDDLG